ncbi:MAG: hypothetical protein ACPMAQ_12745, partial [Phycisphaerae bacterium]
HWRGLMAEWSAGGQTQAAHLPDGQPAPATQGIDFLAAAATETAPHSSVIAMPSRSICRYGVRRTLTIECHFGPLKKFALNNSDYRTHEDQEAAITSYLTWRNRHRAISMESWKTARNRAA